MTRARDVADTQENLGGGVPPFVAGKNKVLNGNFGVWQRGTSFAVASSTIAYTADRWSAYRSGATGLTVSRQSTSDTTNLPNIQYCTRISRDSGNTSTANLSLSQSFESINSIPLAGQTVTFSFYARKGANYSPTTNYIVLKTGTGTDQNIYSGFTGNVNAILATPTFTSTWTKYQYTALLDSNITQIAVEFNLVPIGTAGAADYLEITGIQVEAGNVATPFTTATGTIQGELAACQRYCYVIQGNTTNASSLGTAYWNGTTAVVGFISSKSKMRTTPTLIFSAASDFEALQVGTSWNAVSAVTLAAEANADTAQIQVTTTGGTNGQAANIRLKALSTAYVGLVAEL